MTFKHKLARRVAHLMVTAATLTLLSCSEGDLKEGFGPPGPAPGAPVAEANGPYNAVVGADLQFSSAGSFDPDGPWTAAWNFGDGVAGEGITPSHSYSSAGTYVVVLVVTDADGATATDSALVTVTATQPPPPPPPQPTPGFPNEPAGYVRFAEYDFSTAPSHGVGNSNGAELDGCVWKWDGNNRGLTANTDGNAPQSPNGVLDVLFAQGHPSGSGPGFYQLWDTCSETNNTEYSKIYVSIRIKLLGPDWESHPILTKWLGYWGVGRNGRGVTPTQGFGLIDGNGIGSLFTFAWINQDVTSRRLSQNVNTYLRIQAGVWHHIELVMELNSAPDVADGILRWYLDGQLALDYNNVVWRTSADPSGFYGRRYNPVWGGQSIDPKTRSDHIYIDHEYMSGVP